MRRRSRTGCCCRRCARSSIPTTSPSPAAAAERAPSFAGEIAGGRTLTARRADPGSGGTDWSVTATPRALGLRLPARSRAITRQQFDGGRLGDNRLSASARIRPATVDVEVTSEGELASWLKPGRHLGAVVERSTFTLAPPTF